MEIKLESVKGEVFGKVQGVFYRAETKRHAQRLGLSGWVRNTSRGSVEFVLQGDKPAISIMLQWMEKGPFLAKVEKLETEPSENFVAHGERSKAFAILS